MTDTPTAQTTPTTDPLSDLYAADVEAMEGEALAVAVARVQGWTDIISREFDVLAGLPHEYSSMHRDIERPDRDPAAAVQLLCEMAERYGESGVELFAGLPSSLGRPYVLAYAERQHWSYARRGLVNDKPTPEGFCVAVCRAYLKAWQAERRAKRETGGEG